MMARDEAACSVCGSEDPRPFFRMASMPVVCNRLFDDPASARAVARGDLDLVRCGACGFVFNRAFEPDLVPYGESYENSLHFSPRFRRFAEELARGLIERYGVRGERVVEIACGNGEFLSLLCELGENEGVGFDPSAVAERAAEGSARARIVPEYFSEKHARERARLICCRHALEHVADPLGFVRTLRHALGAEAVPVVYFEVPNGAWIFEEHDLWDLIYEHFGYFAAPNLRLLFERAGFDVLRVDEAFGRQFLSVEARPTPPREPSRPASAPILARASGFPAACADRVASWREALARIARDGGHAVVWGAGSKGITFANCFRDEPALAALVDVNPHKAGRYVSGTGHPILAPRELAKIDRLALVVAMNPLYVPEIEAALRELGLATPVRPA